MGAIEAVSWATAVVALVPALATTPNIAAVGNFVRVARILRTRAVICIVTIKRCNYHGS